MNFKLLKAISQRPPFEIAAIFCFSNVVRNSFKLQNPNLVSKCHSGCVDWRLIKFVTAMLSHVHFVMGSFYLSWSSALLHNLIYVVGFAMNLVSFETFRNLYEVFGRHCFWVGNILNSQSCNAKNHLPTLNHLGATIGVCFRWLENGK